MILVGQADPGILGSWDPGRFSSRIKFDMVVPPLSVKTESTNISHHPLSPLVV